MPDKILAADFGAVLKQRLIIAFAVVVLTMSVTWASGLLADRYTGTEARRDLDAIQRDFRLIHAELAEIRALLTTHQVEPAHPGQAIAQARNEERLDAIAANQKRILDQLGVLQSRLVDGQDNWIDR